MTRDRRPARRVLVVLLIAYTIIIGLATLTPAHIDQQHDGLIGRTLELFAAHRVTSWLTYDTVEKLANVTMFVPFGFLLAMLCRRSRWWIGWLAGAVFSCVIEGTQATLLAASRVADVSDLITNALGAGIGALLALVIKRAGDSRRAPPTVGNIGNLGEVGAVGDPVAGDGVRLGAMIHDERPRPE